MNKTDVLIIGAGPTGLFCAHQLGIIGLSCEIVDNLDKAGGQCIELYPDKPIYDIPAVPECTGEELTNNLLKQIKPFNIKFHLNERVEQLKKTESRWNVKTSGGKEFDVASIVIAGGVGSFEPRKFSVKECEKFEGNSLLYSIKNKSIFKNKTISIFGGGDSALDWAIELSNTSNVNLIHRRDGFSGADSSVQKVKNLNGQGKLNLFTKYQLDSVSGDKNIESIKKVVVVTHPHKNHFINKSLKLNVSDIVNNLIKEYPKFEYLNFSNYVENSKIFGNNFESIWLKDEVHLNEEAYTNYFLPNIIKFFK